MLGSSRDEFSGLGHWEWEYVDYAERGGGLRRENGWGRLLKG